ncbi:MAG: putative Ig domain-containing protein, partial [bacterium]|nr:putative Ig domain-containing protein [bacterium]
MKVLSFLILSLILISGTVMGQAEGYISLDHVDGTLPGDSVQVGSNLTFHLRLTNNSGGTVTGFTNGFMLYSPDGATWQQTTAAETGAITDAMISQRFTNLFSVDGVGADTAGFGGFKIFESGILDGFDEVTWTLGTGAIGMGDAGKTICIDTAFYPPASFWKWSTTIGDLFPGWSGLQCLTIVDSSFVPNRPPILAAIGQKMVVEGDLLYFDVLADDPDGDTVTLEVSSGLPPLASFVDSGNGLGYFWWQPSFDQAGSYNVTFRATDQHGASDSEIVSIIVNDVGSSGEASISLIGVNGLLAPDTLMAGQVIDFYFAAENLTGDNMYGFTNGFEIYSPSGAQWSHSTGSFFDVFSSGFDLITQVDSFSNNGMGVDTIGFGGARLASVGIPHGYSDSCWQISIGPIDSIYVGHEICIDSSFYPPVGAWRWESSTLPVFPDWDGPHCFVVGGGTVQTPRIAYVYPDTATQGQTLWVEMTGENTHFLHSSSTTVRLSNGPTTIYANSFNIFSDTMMTMFLNIPANATTGAYDIEYFGSFENATLINGFTVYPAGQPELVGIFPDHAQVGDSLWVDIIGRNTHFTQASNTYVSLVGFDTIYVEHLTPYADTAMRGLVNVYPYIRPEYKMLNVWQDGLRLYKDSAFRVEDAAPCSLGIQPQMVDFYMLENSPPDSQLAFVTSNCIGVNYYANDTVPWLSGHPVSGYTPDSMWVVADPSGMMPGTYGGGIDIYDGSFNPSYASVYVRLQVIADTNSVHDFSLDHVDGLSPGGKLPTGGYATFYLRQRNGASSNIVGLTNGFSVYSPDGAFWNTTVGDTTGANVGGMLENFFITPSNVDGFGADTIGFGGFRFILPGIPSNFDDIVYSMRIGPIDTVSQGKTICLDSAFYPPAGVWKWSTDLGDYDPSWGGPYCYAVEGGTITDSCQLELSLDEANFIVYNHEDPPCQYLSVGQECTTWTQHDSSWYSVDSVWRSWPDSSSLESGTNQETAIPVPVPIPGMFYQICVDPGLLPPGHYHDTLWVFSSDAPNYPEYLLVNMQIYPDTMICGSNFAGNLIVIDSSGMIDTSAILGARIDATDGYDPGVDLFELGFPMPPYLRVFFPHPEYGLMEEGLRADYRSWIRVGCKTWPLVIDKPFPGDVSIHLNLWDPNTTADYNFNLRNSNGQLLMADIDINHYTYFSMGGPSEFIIEACCSPTSCTPTYFTNYVETGKSYSYVLNRPPICGGLESGDEIGLFDKQKGLLVGGFVYCNESFPLAIPAWEGDSTLGLPGYTPGNELELQIYKKRDDSVLCTEIFGDCLQFDACAFGKITTIDCVPCYEDFCTPFPIHGYRWQLLSSPVLSAIPNECDVSNTFGSLSGLVIVENDQGEVYIPSFNINDIGCINVCEGYNVYREGVKDTLCIPGAPVNPGICMVQPQRWNMIGYPLLCELPIEQALSSIRNCIDIVMDDEGRIYIPGSMFPINTIGNMIPGKGYYLHLNCNTEVGISWPSCGGP